jgi:hypothetical protein
VPGPPHYRAFTITLRHTPQSVGLLWTRDRPIAETSTWQHTALTTETSMPPGGIRTRNPSKRTSADPRLRRRGQWDGLCLLDKANTNYCYSSYLRGDDEMRFLMEKTQNSFSLWLKRYESIVLLNFVLSVTKNSVKNWWKQGMLRVILLRGHWEFYCRMWVKIQPEVIVQTLRKWGT